MDIMDKPVIHDTGDGSQTIYAPSFNASYHSSHGAIQESQHVFIQNGLAFASSLFHNEIFLLEFGFGTGLNAFLTAIWSDINKINVHYVGIEAYPLDLSIVDKINYPSLSTYSSAPYLFKDIQKSNWGVTETVLPFFSICKIKNDFSLFPCDYKYNLVYLDAFAPSVQPDFWENPFLQQVFDAMSPGGVLVTYCAKGSFKRALRSAGFIVEALPGPIGKREITRAIKPIHETVNLVK
jgi:tRNA U34 5-methylaminomethyl-2-thiouridine-forming methyltransferase MnmC